MSDPKRLKYQQHTFAHTSLILAQVMFYINNPLTSLLKNAELVRGFDFAKGAPVLKVSALSDAKRPPIQGGGFSKTHTRLYDLETDSCQEYSFRSAELETFLNEFLRRELKASDTLVEIYSRFSLQK